jgi:hypothetical protein
MATGKLAEALRYLWFVAIVFLAVVSTRCAAQERSDQVGTEASVEDITLSTLSVGKTNLSAFSRKEVEPILAPEPKAPKRSINKSFWYLSAGVYVAAGLDMGYTINVKNQFNGLVLQGVKQGCTYRYGVPRFSDGDPLARPIVSLPTPAYVASGTAIATAINFLSWKMARSRRFRKIWYLPQVVSIGGNAWGFTTNLDY